MTPFDRDFVTDFDLGDPELNERWDELVADLHARCPVARSEVREDALGDRGVPRGDGFTPTYETGNTPHMTALPLLFTPGRRRGLTRRRHPGQ
jgi:hypothetical protein